MKQMRDLEKKLGSKEKERLSYLKIELERDEIMKRDRRAKTEGKRNSAFLNVKS